MSDEPENAALAGFAVHTEGKAVVDEDGLCDGKPQPCADLAGVRAGAVVFVKDIGKIFPISLTNTTAPARTPARSAQGWGFPSQRPSSSTTAFPSVWTANPARAAFSGSSLIEPDIFLCKKGTSRTCGRSLLFVEKPPAMPVVRKSLSYEKKLLPVKWQCGLATARTNRRRPFSE